MNNSHSQEYSTFMLFLDYTVLKIFINDEVDSLWILSLDNRLKSQNNKIIYIFGKDWLDLSIAVESTVYYWVLLTPNQ